MNSFAKIIGDAMREDSELFELSKWGDEMFALQDQKNTNKHWTEKYINDEDWDDASFERGREIGKSLYNEWDFPEPPNICR